MTNTIMIDNRIQQNVPLAPMTSFKIGGPAKFFVEVSTEDELIDAISWAKEKGEQTFILGGGSNVLINDNGVEGLVIKLNNGELTIKGERLECGAGCLLSRAMGIAAGNNLSGLEWAAGIPGTIGGAIRGNAGVVDGDMGKIVETVEAYNLSKNTFERLSNNECHFGYRDSIFKDNKNLLIWKAELRLQQTEAEEIKKSIDMHLKKRTASQPKLPSAGSVFKNLRFDDLSSHNKNLSSMAVELGKEKDGLVAAGWIIEMSGLKGKTIGKAKISLEHANFIVNTGNASSEDVIMLISFIKQQVRLRFNVQLFEEIQYFGM